MVAMVPTDFPGKFLAAIESGDATTLEALIDNRCMVHANFSDAPNDRPTTLRVVRWLHGNVQKLCYVSARLRALLP
jgi:hypothetical protein